MQRLISLFAGRRLPQQLPAPVTALTSLNTYLLDIWLLPTGVFEEYPLPQNLLQPGASGSGFCDLGVSHRNSPEAAEE